MWQIPLVRFLSASALLLSILLISARSPSSANRVSGMLSPTGSMQHPRASHTASLLPDDTVLVAGGFAGSGSESRPYISTELFDPASGTFHTGPDMTVVRSGHAAVVLKDNRVLLVGG